MSKSFDRVQMTSHRNHHRRGVKPFAQRISIVKVGDKSGLNLIAMRTQARPVTKRCSVPTSNQSRTRSRGDRPTQRGQLLKDKRGKHYQTRGTLTRLHTWRSATRAKRQSPRMKHAPSTANGPRVFSCVGVIAGAARGEMVDKLPEVEPTR